MYLPNSLHARDVENYLHGLTNLDLHRKVGPNVVARGSETRVYDDEGREFIDAVSGLYCASLGFMNERVAKVASEQLGTLAYYHTHSHATNPSAVELSERLIACAPVPMSKVFFLCSGSEANDFAIKLVWYYHHAIGKPKKRKIIGRMYSYHGSTIASISASGKPEMHVDFGVPIDGFLHTDAAQYYRFHEDGETEEAYSTRLAATLEDLILREGPETIGAFIAEPMMGAGGMIMPPATYFQKVQDVLNKYDILFIADEVVCGFGRTGDMWGSTTFGITPDIITAGKGLSAGFQPISAVLINDKVYQQMLAESRKLGLFAHSATYSGHPVAAAVTLEVQKIYEEMNLVEHVRSLGAHLASRLSELSTHPLVGEIQSVGLSAALEIVESKAPRRWFDPSMKVGEKLVKACRERGIALRVIRDRITLAPPFTMTPRDIDIIVDGVRSSINSVADGL